MAALVSGCAPASAARTAISVHRDPSCGCCGAWVDLVRADGRFQVSVVDEPDLARFKQQHRVPPALTSCHTAIVDGLVIEGHVPIEDVLRLIHQRPSLIAGIGVAGMPAGSPGMEIPSGEIVPYEVVAFTANGVSSVFARHGRGA